MRRRDFITLNALLPLGRPAPGRFPPADMFSVNLIFNQKSNQACATNMGPNKRAQERERAAARCHR